MFRHPSDARAGLQICWPQMMYLTLRSAARALTQSRIARPFAVPASLRTCSNRVRKSLKAAEALAGREEERWVTYTTTRGAHEINGQSAAMLARAWASTVPGTKDFADLAGQSADSLLRTVYSSSLACAHSGDPRRGKAARWGSAWETALEFRGAWAQSCLGSARGTCIGETAVSTATA